MCPWFFSQRSHLHKKDFPDQKVLMEAVVFGCCLVLVRRREEVIYTGPTAANLLRLLFPLMRIGVVWAVELSCQRTFVKFHSARRRPLLGPYPYWRSIRFHNFEMLNRRLRIFANQTFLCLHIYHSMLGVEVLLVSFQHSSRRRL